MSKKRSQHNPELKARVGLEPMKGIVPIHTEELVGKIDAMADAENRNRSDFIANVLQALATKTGV